MRIGWNATCLIPTISSWTVWPITRTKERDKSRGNNGFRLSWRVQRCLGLRCGRKMKASPMRRVYLDNNATTPILPEVFEAMQPYFAEHFGNASSIHHHGQETRAAVESARESVAALVGCRAAEIVFTSGGTEGDNLAIAGLTAPGDHVITTAIEHHA